MTDKRQEPVQTFHDGHKGAMEESGYRKRLKSDAEREEKFWNGWPQHYTNEEIFQFVKARLIDDAVLNVWPDEKPIEGDNK